MDVFISNVMENPIPFFLYLALIIILILLSIREIRCWYWKINKRIDIQNDENLALQSIIDAQEKQIQLLETIISNIDKNTKTTADTLDEAATTTESIKEQ